MLIKAKKRKIPQNLTRAKAANINDVHDAVGLINSPIEVAPLESSKAMIQNIKEELSPEEKQALVEQMRSELEQEKETLLQQFSEEIEIERQKAMAEVNHKIDETQARELAILDKEKEINQFLENEKRILDEKAQAEWSKIQETEQQLKTQYEQAIQTAQEQGYQEGKQRLDLVSAEFENIINNIHRAKEELLNEIEPIITSLALDVARKILKRESRLDKQLISEQVKSSVKKVTAKNGLLEISINPADIIHEHDLEKTLAKMLDKEVRLIFQENPSIAEGSCIIETRGGQLDSSFAVQIESIKLAFEKFLGREVELLEELPDEELQEQEISEIAAIAPPTELVEEESEPQEVSAIEELAEPDIEIENQLAIKEEFRSDINKEDTKSTEPDLFDEETARLINELDDDFKVDTSSENAAIEMNLDLSEIDSELEEILSAVIEEKTDTEEIKDLEPETKEIKDLETETEEIKDLEPETEEKTKTEEIKEHIEEMTLHDLEALFDNDKEEALGSDLDFILSQLDTVHENTPDNPGKAGFKDSSYDIEDESMDPLKNEQDLNLELDSPSEEDLLNIENNMNDLITEIENEDIDELEAIMNSKHSDINIDLVNENTGKEKAEIEVETVLEISEDEILGNFDEESFDEKSFDEEHLEEDDNLTSSTVENNKSHSYSNDSDDSDPDEPEFESFDESMGDNSYNDDYSDGHDPRFPDY